VLDVIYRWGSALIQHNTLANTHIQCGSAITPL
jgi:hypothetical protein